MIIQHNIPALNSYRNLTNNNSQVAKNLEKLSSGYRINRAGDDAAGLAISEKMRAQIVGLETAQKNAKDGISLVQTAEGALTEVHSMLNRMVELADQSANGVYDNATDRANLQKELSSLKSEVDRIADGTNFNGIKLLDGSMGTGSTGVEVTNAAGKAKVSGLEAGTSVTFANNASEAITFAADGSATITIDATKAHTQADIDKLISNATLPKSAANLKIDVGAGLTAAATTGTGVVADAKNASLVSNGMTVTADKAGVDARTFQITSAAGAIGATRDAADGHVTLNLDSAKSYTASEINGMLSEAGAGMSIAFDGAKTSTDLAKSNATGGFGTASALAGGAGLTGGGLTLQIGDTSEKFNKLEVAVGDMHTTALGIGSINVGTQDGAAAAIDKIKAAINSVSSTRGDLGAIQNRLEHTVNNLSVTTENMTAAESRIRDVDMAKEMMAYTKNNILVQSSQAMLAQANQIPQGVLQLLK